MFAPLFIRDAGTVTLCLHFSLVEVLVTRGQLSPVCSCFLFFSASKACSRFQGLLLSCHWVNLACKCYFGAFKPELSPLAAPVASQMSERTKHPFNLRKHPFNLSSHSNRYTHKLHAIHNMQAASVHATCALQNSDKLVTSTPKLWPFNNAQTFSTGLPNNTQNCTLISSV